MDWIFLGGKIINRLEMLSKEVIDWNKVIHRDTKVSEQLQESLVQEEILETLEAVKNQDIVEELDAIADVFFTGVYLEYCYPYNPLVKQYKDIVYDGVNCYGEDLVYAVIEEVIESNYTKFLKTENPEEEKEYLEAELDRTITYRLCPDGVSYVFLNENNKVMKPRGYRPPDIKKIVDKYKVKT